MNEEIRWKQRFANYQKALRLLCKFIEKGDGRFCGHAPE
jgi:hypothetical protein